MSARPGHDSGQPFDWAHFVAWLVASRGSLSAVADHLAAQRGHSESVESIERGLRRLRQRAGGDGGTWGTRCLRTFGLPGDVEARLRWMGHYHTRFTDLPVSVCVDLLRPWDRPPVSESPARAWIQLGLASLALRRREADRAAELLGRVHASGPAKAEHLLVSAFVESRTRRDAVPSLLDEADAIIRELPEDEHRACLWARLVDQRGYVLNIEQRDPEAAYALYASIPADGPPFTRVRRHNGLGWSALKLGRPDEARRHAYTAVEAAGDGGSLRLRVMALKLLAHAATGDEAAHAHGRAKTIATRLEDELLAARL